MSYYNTTEKVSYYGSLDELYDHCLRPIWDTHKEFVPYPLWAFTNGRLTAITRGSTEERALQHITKIFPRGHTVYPCPVPIYAAKSYSRNHAPGWKYRLPVYERRLRSSSE